MRKLYTRKEAMNELALFAGAGGGILGGYLLGWRTRCAVEIDPFCQKQLLARQRDGLLPQFPIWDDIRTFDGRPWKVHIDIITGGFPCTDISAAGKGAGITGQDSGLFFEMLRIIEEVRPRFVCAENSPHLRTKGLGVVVEGLARLGYVGRVGVLGARHIGANHQRNRMWVVAHTDNPGKRTCPVNAEVAWASEDARLVEETTNADRQRGGSGRLSRRTQPENPNVEKPVHSGSGSRTVTDTYREFVRDQPGRGSGPHRQDTPVLRDTDWGSFPRFEGMDDGGPNRMDRVRATGNMQVPAVVRLAWEILQGLAKLRNSKI